jgi:hypothetical protein
MRTMQTQRRMSGKLRGAERQVFEECSEEVRSGKVWEKLVWVGLRFDMMQLILKVISLTYNRRSRNRRSSRIEAGKGAVM